MDNFIPKQVPFNPISLGYIVLNPKLGREEYIEKCLSTHTVDILLNDGTYFEECQISTFESTNIDGSYSALTFPKEKKDLGSTVVLAKAYGSRKPIILSFLPNTENKVVVKNEGQSYSTKTFEDCVIRIDKNPKNGTIDISINRKTKAKINISSFSASEDSEINLSTNGKLTATAKEMELKAYSKFTLNMQDKVKQDKVTTLVSELGVGITVTDEFENIIKIDSSGVNIQTKKDINLKAEGNFKADITGNADITGKNINVKGSDVKITGGNLQVDGSVTPSTGPFCAIPNCVFSGAPHTGNAVKGT